MLIALLIAGIVFLLAGLAGIALGIPVKEFSFGNTEILAGVITACTGVLMLALWIVVRELKRTASWLATGSAMTARVEFSAPPADESDAPRDLDSGDDGFLFNRDQPGASHQADAEPAAPPSAPPPWHEETAARDRVRNGIPPAEAEPAPKRRNLLFSSTSRKERERAEGRTSDLSAADPHSAVAPPPPPVRPAEAPPASFEDAWPQVERARTTEAPVRRGVRPPPANAEAQAGAVPAERRPASVRDEEPAQVTILKSGVVDGMAYSLYSDGSIEAQMPEGMMRFASIDDLRTHLDQRT